MTDQPVRLALVGAGIFTRDAHVPALNALGDQIEVVAVYSRTQKSADTVAALFGHEVATYTDLDALLAREDIDAVDITLPIPLIPDAVRRALVAGKHVVSEKPMAPSVADGHALLDFYADHRDKVWMVAENWRYHALFRTAADLIAAGRIGKPVMCTWNEFVTMDTSNKYYHTEWRRTGEFQGGFILDGGVHRAAALRMMLGEVASVSGFSRQVRPDLNPVDTISAALRFESGALGAYSITFAAGAPWTPTLDVVGDSGALRISGYQVIELTSGGNTDTIQVPAASDVQAELDAFAHSVLTGEPHLDTPEEGLLDVALMEAMLRAGERGEIVKPAEL
jgi:predicted dehydrogenase